MPNPLELHGQCDETKTTTGYGPQTTGMGNNLLPVSVTRVTARGR